ncbi:MAG: NAD-dependent epimerase/dehydratase family protein [Thermodesulfobacteriota bacterium]|nr:NAD-dependent epimerase/dehydratase family protein [Thermodesulfobacteriota bacterium]
MRSQIERPTSNKKKKQRKDVGGQRIEVGDIGPETDWSEAMDGIKGIMHLAARVHVMRESVADPLAAFRLVNVAGAACLARQAAEAGVKRLVYLSSIKVNGEGTLKRGERREEELLFLRVMFLSRGMRMLFPSGKQSSCWLRYPVRPAWK